MFVCKPFRSVPLACAAFALALCPPLQASDKVALAEALYQAARELMAAGNYAEACPKFAESQRLDPATGTLLNLATCHEGQGKFASAWVEFTDAVAASRRDNRPDRVEFAESRLREIEPKLSYLTITAAPGVDTHTLEVRLNGAVVGSAALGIKTPLDPGVHLVEATAPGMQAFSRSVTVGGEADHQLVSIPAFTPKPETPNAPPTPPPGAPPPAPSTPPSASGVPATGAEVGADTGVSNSVYVAGGITVALGVGTVVTGALYLERRADYTEAHARGDYDAAKTLGIVNLTLAALTAAGAGVTGYLYFSEPRAATASLSPVVGNDFRGFELSGTF